MNIVSVNETLKDLPTPRSSPRISRILTHRLGDLCLLAYAYPSSDNGPIETAINANVASLDPLPFNDFRFWIDDHVFGPVVGVVSKSDQDIEILAHYTHGDGDLGSTFEVVVRPRSPHTRGFGYEVWVRSSSRGWLLTQDGDLRGLGREVATRLAGLVLAMCRDFMANDYALETPAHDPSCKSVQWVQARQCVRLVRRRGLLDEPAEKPQRVVKNSPCSEIIVRSAGWRRGHSRELRAQRFTQKRGQRVPVRQAWVGPKTWGTPGHASYLLISQK